MQKVKKEMNKDTFKILVSCCLFYGAFTGMLVNCNGQFYASIAESLGVSLGNITISSAIMGLASLIATSFVVKAYRIRNARVVTAFAILAYSLSYMMTGFINQLWQYYLISVVRGMFQGFLMYYLVSSLIKAWFTEKAGRALSITAFSSGIVGIGFNLLVGFGIDTIGWRKTLIFSCLLAIIVALPGMCLCLYRTPEEKAGIQQIRGIHRKKKFVNTETEKKSKKEIESFSVFLLGLIMTVFWVLPYCFTQHLKIYAMSEGLSQMMGASLISVSMAGNIISKLLLSIWSDRIGAKKSAEMVLMAIIAGFLLLLLPSSEWLLYGGSFLLGTSASFIPILIPQITAVVYQGKAFEAVYSKYTTVLSMSSAVWISVIGALYSLFEEYRPLFTGGLFIIIISVGMLQLFTKNSMKEQV